jgi:hypothetical protein
MSEFNKEIDESGDASAKTDDNWSSEPPQERDVASKEAPVAEKKPGPDPNVFPDGGWEAWLAVAGGFFTVFASFGWINCAYLRSRTALVWHPG